MDIVTGGGKSRRHFSDECICLSALAPQQHSSSNTECDQRTFSSFFVWLPSTSLKAATAAETVVVDAILNGVRGGSDSSDGIPDRLKQRRAGSSIVVAGYGYGGMECDR